ncbi:metallophosphoesterase [Desulfoscipio gibsoniae]
MPAVVAISDLHLGEESSSVNPLLREVVPAILKDRPEFQKPPLNTTPVRLNTLLHKIAREHGGISDLVLVGDVIDLSLASYTSCVIQAREFFRQLLAGVLPGALVWVPGNHDHHIWVQVCEEEYIAAPLREGNLPEEFPGISGPGRDTGALNRCNRGARFLLGLLPAHVWERFWLAYPNYVTTCGRENLLFHHGHFFDRAQSWIGTSLIEAQSLSELEILNSAYLDYISYGCGQSGRLSGQIENIYEEIRWVTEKFGMVLDIITMKRFFKWLLGLWGRENDRGNELGPKMAERIGRYLQYIEQEEKTAPFTYPLDFSLIFGHTHRPLAGAAVGKHPVYNTGGWTVDERWPGADKLHTGVFVAVPGRQFTVQPVAIDRDVYDFCHRLNHAYREAVDIDLGAPG